MAIKTILFDCWGTLVENGVASPIKQVKDILGITLPFSPYVLRLERSLMTEKISNLEEGFRRVCQEFGITPTTELLDQLIGTWNKNWMLAQPYEEVEETLTQLKKDYQLVLISNTDNVSITKILEKLGWEHYFDRIFLSCDVRALKSDRFFYPTILQELRRTPEECLVVGDSIQSDIIPAKLYQLPVVLMDRRDTRTFSPKITNLQELAQHLP